MSGPIRLPIVAPINTRHVRVSNSLHARPDVDGGGGLEKNASCLLPKAIFGRGNITRSSPLDRFHSKRNRIQKYPENGPKHIGAENFRLSGSESPVNQSGNGLRRLKHQWKTPNMGPFGSRRGWPTTSPLVQRALSVSVDPSGRAKSLSRQGQG